VVLVPGVADTWWFPALAAVVALLGLALIRRSVMLMLVAAGLAALGAQSAALARVKLEVSAEATSEHGFPVVDLREGGVSGPAPPYIRVRGYVRTGWTLDEYAVERGDLPDQSGDPVAVLVPMTGSPTPSTKTGEGEPNARGNALRPDEAVVVVRVAPRTPFDAASPSTVQGKTEPLDPELLTTLVQLEGDPSEVRGVLVDTLALPSRQDAWLEAGLAAIALLVSMACAFFAAAPRDG